MDTTDLNIICVFHGYFTSIMSERVIRASEIGQYDFCAKAWWLNVIEGVPSENVGELQLGTQAHERHGQQVGRAGSLQQLAVVLLIAGVVLLAVFILGNGV
ncbi:MAG TPA: hypothetical protein VFF70_11910 [Anaerolineae bacterium]|nr:hypothetical protein [Anaerolineae bacterium]